jgi:lambda repressor-like predicted transcriptional regulator
MHTLLLLLLLLPQQSLAKAAIKSSVVYTNSHLKQFKQITRPHEDGISLEGGQSAAYYSKDTLKLIVDKTYGETSQIVAHYYFNNKQLIFAYIVKYDYNVPINLEQFDLKKSRKTEQRYYPPINKEIQNRAYSLAKQFSVGKTTNGVEM